MKGTVIIPRRLREFEVAHRIEAGDHYLEVSVGSSFNELYWDFSAKEFVAEPATYQGVPEVLCDLGAGWLLALLPGLADGTINLTSEELSALAEPDRAHAPETLRRGDVLADLDHQFYESLGAERPNTQCRHNQCDRGTVQYSVFCASHHFESVKGRSWEGGVGRSTGS